MKRKIYIDGRHWDNIMQLSCVRGLNKRGEGYVVKVKVGKASTVFAEAGDAIVEKDDGSWSVEKKESMAPRRLKTGNMLCPYYNEFIEESKGTSVVICTVDSEIRTCEWTPESGCFMKLSSKRRARKAKSASKAIMTFSVEWRTYYDTDVQKMCTGTKPS